MEAKRLMKVTYQDLKKGIRLNAYADAVIWSEDPSPTLAGLRFGGYAEVVRGLTDAIYGGATIEIEDADGSLLTLKSLSKQYHREVSHEGLYAEATLIAEDEIQESSKSQDEKSRKHAQKDDLFDDDVPQQDIPAHICYIFCHPGNEDELFQAIDQKSYVPMIPEYQDYVLAELKRRRILRPLRVRSLYQELEAWKLCCEAKDQNLVKVMEDGLKQGKIKIPGAAPGPSLLDGVHSVTDYLNTFGVAVAERIKKLFVPLFDPATEPLSEEVLDINEYIRAHAGYSLYDAQLAVAESIKRKLGQSKVALIVAGCGTGKTKIGSVAVAAAGLQSHQISAGHSKTFSIVLCPAHVTKKWVREIEESIPNTFAAVVRSISEFDLLYKLYEQGSRNCFAIISKEKARDGYMRAPAVIFRKWNREGLNIARPRANEEMPAVGFSPLRHVFCCPDCGAVIMENISKDGVAYCVPAGPRFFRSENRENHKCKICGSSLWTALNPTLWNQQTQWAKLGSYGYEECLLLVTGETVSLNTFDKIFRSGYGPQWSDRPRSHTAHYSFHALFPVPEAVQRRGFDAAGRLWCKEYWESSDDLLDMQVRRALGRRQYRFFVPEPLPKNFFRVVSHDYPSLAFQLATLVRDGGSPFFEGRETLHQYLFQDGRYSGSQSPNRENAFSQIREEMGFLP